MTLIAMDGNGRDNGRDAGLITSKGRPVIFTPERMEQIRNLVERGHGREEIAKIVGCTLGSLQVTCSRLGISLRRPRDEAPVKAVKRTPPIIIPDPPKPSDTTRAPESALEPPGGWPPGHPWGGNDPKDKPAAKFTLRVTHGERTYDLPLAIDNHSLCELACMADLSGVPLTEMIARALVAGIKGITS